MTYTFQVKNGDYVLGKATGRPVRLFDKPKASQTMARMLGIEKPMGAGLDELVGSVPDDPLSFSSDVQTDIRDAFDRTVSVQAMSQQSERTAAEQLSYIASMFVQPAQFQAGVVSKTGFVLKVDVVTVAGEELALQRSLITP